MLQSYSWSAFFLVCAGLVLIWYLGLALTVYRKECISFFTSSREGPVLIAPVADSLVQNPVAPGKPERISVMGKSRLAEGLVSSSSIELGFKGDGNGEEIGLKSDVIAELKEIFTLLAENDGDKSDFFELIGAMKNRYPPIGSHPAFTAINAFIRSHAPFLVSPEELENLWD